MSTRALVAAAILIGLTAARADASSDPAIDRWISRHADRMNAIEQRAARYAVVGDLDGDGRRDVAVLYTIEDVPPGRRRLRYLAAFRRADDGLEFKAHTLVGGRGMREVNRATILNRSIELETLEYGPLDAPCCPSTPARSRYRLAGDKLVRTAVQASP